MDKPYTRLVTPLPLFRKAPDSISNTRCSESLEGSPIDGPNEFTGSHATLQKRIDNSDSDSNSGVNFISYVYLGATRTHRIVAGTST